MDLTVLLQSKGDDSPSGDNLEYDPTFTEMELAAQPGEERQLGDEITEAKDPDYREVRERALEVLERSHDLRAAVFLADAILYSDGLTGFAQVMAYIRGCLEQFWETCHPELDEDDGDPTMRINAIQALCGQPGEMAGPSPVYQSLRRAPLTDSRGFGRFGLRDIEITEGQIPVPANMERVPDSASVTAAFKDTDPAKLAERLEAVKAAAVDAKAISAVFDEHTPGQGPDLDPLVKLLNQIARRIGEHVAAGDKPAEDVEIDAGSDQPAQSGARAPAAGGTGAINSSNDVIAALDRIMAYYKRNEPSSPIPILLGRAKKLVNADFLTIVADMAPQGVSHVNLIGGIEDE